MRLQDRQFLQQLIEEALQQPANERRRWIASRTAHDPALHAQAEALLAATESRREPAGREPVNPSLTRTLEASHQPKSGILPEGRFLPGEIFAGRYRIVSLLGRGGMGEVYRAFDLQLEQGIALKFLPSAKRDAAALERFRNEVRTARQVTHPNVCRVYDIGESDDAVYLTMEYIDGEDLASLLLRIGRLPEDKGVQMALQLCAGLAAAHEKGVLHRDLKPANIMIDGRGQLRVTDFGLAALSNLVSGRDAANGTPLYMAPEQLSGEQATQRSDIYALGLVLYELFTGRRPFEASSLEELRSLRRHASPSQFPSITNLDPALERTILRCLEADPRQRPASARALFASLPRVDPLAAALAGGETPSPGQVAASGEEGRLPLAAAIFLLAFVLLGLIFVPFFAYRVGWLSRTNLDRPPQVLAQRARDLAAQFGYRGAPRDAVYGFDRQVNGLPVFWYRQADCEIQADQLANGTLPPGRVRLTNPADPCPNIVSMELDVHGSLISWLRHAAIPTPNPAATGPNPPAPPLEPLFAAAGLDQSRLTEIAPPLIPAATFDRLAAWTTGRAGEPAVQRVEAAFWRGEPVYFSYLDASGSARSPAPGPRPSGITIALCILLAGLTGCILLARRNLRTGRADRRGAFRLSAVMFALCLFAWAFQATHRLTFFEVTLFVYALGWALAMAGFVWLLYVALDPFVRRRWPHAIVSLSRVLDFRIRDPLVARDILFGLAASVVYAALALVQMQVNHVANATPAASALTGAGYLTGLLAYDAEVAIWAALFLFCLVFLLRIALRRSWLVALTLIVLLAVIGGLSAGSLPGAAIAAAFSAVSICVLLRFGLLCFMVQAFVGPILPVQLYTSDLSAWYAAPPLVILVAIAGAACWAFRLTLPNRTWISDELLFR